MAFLCVLGVNAAPSGTGTKADPYVIADGDTYVVNDIVYASFTAPADGTLSLAWLVLPDIYVGGWNSVECFNGCGCKLFFFGG